MRERPPHEIAVASVSRILRAFTKLALAASSSRASFPSGDRDGSAPRHPFLRLLDPPGLVAMYSAERGVSYPDKPPLLDLIRGIDNVFELSFGVGERCGLKGIEVVVDPSEVDLAVRPMVGSRSRVRYSSERIQ